jgi:hypothetical protein
LPLHVIIPSVVRPTTSRRILCLTTKKSKGCLPFPFRVVHFLSHFSYRFLLASLGFLDELYCVLRANPPHPTYETKKRRCTCTSDLHCDWLVSRSRIGRRDAIEGNIRGDIVSRHDVLHAAHVFGDIVAIVLAGVFQPLGVVVVELALVIG